MSDPRDKNLGNKPLAKEWLERNPINSSQFNDILQFLLQFYYYDNHGYINLAPAEYRFNGKNSGYVVLVARANENIVWVEGNAVWEDKRIQVSEKVDYQDLYNWLSEWEINGFDWHRNNFNLPPILPPQISPRMGRNLGVKSEDETKIILNAKSIVAKHTHNIITNIVQGYSDRFDIEEGQGDCLFDVLFKQYNDKNDLLIEVKSTIDVSDIRMAIGQVMDYRFRLSASSSSNNEVHLAILLPTKPDNHTIDLLKSLGIFTIWIEDRNLKSDSENLSKLLNR